MNKILQILLVLCALTHYSTSAWSSIISPKKINRMTTFARIATDVQYFHPSDAVENTDWERFLTYGMQKVGQSSDDDLPETLRQLFNNIAPSMKINDKSAVDLDLTSAQVKVWINTGYIDPNARALSANNKTTTSMTSIYDHMRGDKDLTEISDENLTYTATYNGITINMPLVQGISAEGHTLPISTPYNDKTVWNQSEGMHNPYVCAAAVTKVWGAIQHFYPYFQSTSVDWSAVLPRLITACEKKSVKNVFMALRAELTQLHDNHLTLNNHGEDIPLYTVPIGLTWTEGKVIAIAKENDDINVTLGDELRQVDGIAVSEIIGQFKPYSLRSDNRQTDEVVLSHLIRRAVNTPVALTFVAADGSEYTVNTQANQYIADNILAAKAAYTFAEYPLIKELGEGYYYVNLAKVRHDDIDVLLEKLNNAKGIILDFRNSPQEWEGWRALLSHFTTKSAASLPMIMHKQVKPNQTATQLEAVSQSIEPSLPAITVPTIVLSSKFSVSQNEHALGNIQNIGLKILGEPTYGIDGNITTIYVHTGNHGDDFFNVIFTGLEVKQNDGSQFIGVGIKPDILVKRTQNGIREHNDEQFESALAYLRNIVD